MKRVLLIILGIVVLAGAAAALFVGRLDAGFIVARIAAVTERATGAPLVLEAAPQLSLLPPGVRFGAARWQGAAGGTALEVSLKGGMARLELQPLFSGNIVISELRLDGPEADIRPGPAGPGDGSATGAPPATGGMDGPGPARKAPEDSLPFELGRLTVTRGALRLEDGERRIAVSGFNLALENLRRREEVSVQGDLVLTVSDAGPASADAAPRLTGNLAFQGALRYYAPNLTFRQVSLAFTPLGGLIPRGLAPLQLTGEGALDLASLEFRLGAARLSAPQARLTFAGQGRLAPAALAGKAQLTGSAGKLAALAGLTVPQGEPDSLDLRCRVELAGHGLRLAGMDGEAAGVRLGGDLTLELPTAQRPHPALRGSLALGSVDIAPWLAANKGDAAHAAPDAAAPAGGTKAPGATAPGRNAPAALPDLDLSLSIAALRHGAFALQDLSTRLRGAGSRCSLDGLAARLGTGGTLEGTAALDMADHAVSVTATGAGVEIGPLCAAAGKAGLASGTAAFDVRLRARGADSRALLASLAGEGVLEVRDLSAPALADAGAVLQALPVRGLPVPERIARATATFTARGGELTARPVTLTAEGLSARGEARVDMPREFLEGTATVTALGLDLPLVFKGPFSHVQVSVDPKFALELGRKLGGASGAPGAGAARGMGDAVRDGLGAAGGLVRGLLGR